MADDELAGQDEIEQLLNQAKQEAPGQPAADAPAPADKAAAAPDFAVQAASADDDDKLLAHDDIASVVVQPGV